MENTQLYEAALAAIKELFKDESMSQEKAKETLNSLVLEIEKMIDSMDV